MWPLWYFVNNGVKPFFKILLKALTLPLIQIQNITERKAKTDTTFDLIHGIHVFYYVPIVDLEATLLYLYQRLRRGGLLIIIIDSGEIYIGHIERYLIEQ